LAEEKTEEIKPGNLEPYYEIINQVISKLGLKPDECYNAEGKYWSLCKGSADVFVTLFVLGEGADAEWYVEFSSPVMKIPSENLLPFYRRLLEENAKWVATRFSVREDTVWLDTTRELSGMDYDECYRSLTRIGEAADALDDDLKTEFAGGGEAGS
jgi:hypothetical protein